ncbi:hypothetical protein HHI36_007448 [Cryptolaemus montrouzieri]|uniref:Uncharacterized protein n=1 Tax=Cryptolaemus montrouzieri TaxID=559131 RepID=A0ABD2MPK0_9CUCU
MKEYPSTKKSASALSVELHIARQSHKSIAEFGKSIEELMNNLTLAQSCGNNENAQILAKTNENIAITTFANGLRDNDLIVKSRNHAKLRDSVRSAIDEDTSRKNSSSQAFHMRSRGTCNSRGHKGSQRGFFKDGRNYENFNKNSRGNNYASNLTYYPKSTQNNASQSNNSSFRSRKLQKSEKLFYEFK